MRSRHFTCTRARCGQYVRSRWNSVSRAYGVPGSSVSRSDTTSSSDPGSSTYAGVVIWSSVPQRQPDCDDRAFPRRSMLPSSEVMKKGLGVVLLVALVTMSGCGALKEAKKVKNLASGKTAKEIEDFQKRAELAAK